jgi:isochorismate hydrolase
VVDAFAYNWKVLVPWDAVYDRSQVSHAVNLFDMSEKYADVMSVEDALERLSKLPAQQHEQAAE